MNNLITFLKQNYNIHTIEAFLSKIIDKGLNNEQLNKTTSFLRWADQCGPARDTNHNIPGFPNVGQNFGHLLSATPVDDKGLEAIIMEWYDEVKQKHLKYVLFFVFMMIILICLIHFTKNV